MQVEYETDPAAIVRESFRRIRELTELEHLDRVQQQVAMRVVHSLGQPEIAAGLRFSDGACERGREALARDCPILCDVEMVKNGVSRRLVSTPPLCFLNDPAVPDLARKRGETRTMAALEFWRDHLQGSVVLIGNAPTALFRLIEMLRDYATRPALVIAMPVGFVGAMESKQLLWDHHRELDVACITLLGRPGGSAATASVCNSLLHCNQNEWF